MPEREPLLSSTEGSKSSGVFTTTIQNDEQESNSSFFESIIRPCLAEFVGVTLFVFVGTMSVANPSGLVGVALAHGLAIALLVAAFGTISGAHINPAVTLGIVIAGEIHPLRAVFYVVSQFMGGLLGAGLTRGILGTDRFVSINGGATLLDPETTVAGGLLCEVMLTSLLVLIVLLTAVDSSTKSSLAPLAIGFTVAVCILAGGTVSGASMNPARSLGPAIAMWTYSSSVWEYHWLFYVGPGLGALLATVLFRLFFAGPDKRVFGQS